MTRIALPIWEGRVSPVFDVAEHLLFVDFDGTRERWRRLHRVHGPDPASRVQALAAYDVNLLICGAISRTVEHAVTGAGIEVEAGICGDVERVLCAFALGNLSAEAALHLPGSAQGGGEAGRLGGRRTARSVGTQ